MNNKVKAVIIFGVLIFSAWALYPSVQFYTLDADAKARLSTEERESYLENIIKLGLDLQGGMHIVLEIDDSKLTENAKEDAPDRVMEIMRSRVDQFGVAEPVIQRQGEKRVIIQLPGVENPERIRGLIGQTAQLEFRLVRGNDMIGRVLNDLDRVLKGVKIEGSVIDTTGVVSTDTTGTDTTGVDEGDTTGNAPDTEMADASGTEADSLPDISAGLDTLIPELPGVDDVEVPMAEVSEDRPFSSRFLTAVEGGLVADRRSREAINLLLETEQAKRVIPPNSEFLWGYEDRPLQDGGTAKILFLCEKKPTLTGARLVDATTRPDPDDPTMMNVGFRLDREGAIIFSRFTGENIGQRIAIVLDGQIRSAPVVQSKIPGGEGRITGLEDDQEANDLAIVLRAGALPAPVEIIEERTVGPSLGRDSIVLGVRAAIGGFIIVMLFMLIYYRGAGILACLALILNLVIVLAVLAYLRAALTLPGIAGLILTIGMAIDANVLIFERIREELAKAKTVRSAIDAGYDRAFTTILDANVTTLITAFVLWQFGTGPIKGFATTLSIGIVASMFTALMCTRIVFDVLTARRMIKKLSI